MENHNAFKPKPHKKFNLLFPNHQKNPKLKSLYHKRKGNKLTHYISVIKGAKTFTAHTRLKQEDHSNPGKYRH